MASPGITPGSNEGNLKQSWNTQLTSESSIDLEGVGTHRYENGCWYKYVLHDQGAAAVDGVLGEVVYYYTLDGYKNNQVSSDLSDSVEIGAGVLMSTPGDEVYCWIQIKGPATLTIALTAGADGDPLCPTGASDGTLDVTAADTSNICAIAGDISDKEIICDFPW